MEDRAWDLFPPSQTDLFEAFDELKTLDVASHIHGPQLVVVGDQNSGKSSVLEAIIRELFPVDDGLCTRFPIKLVYHRSDNKRYVVRIVPGQSRQGAERQALLDYNVSGPGGDPFDLGKQVSDATTKLGIKRDGTSPTKVGHGTREFCDDVVVIEKHGPDLPRVNLLDLPGLFISETNTQAREGRKVVKKMAEEYIAQRQSIILLIVDGSSQYATQKAPSVVTKMLERDPGVAGRLVGVVTNADSNRLHQDDIKGLLRGDLSPLRPNGGWFILKNDSKEERYSRETLGERDDREAKFFQKDGFWQSVPDSQKGIKMLMGALCSLVQDHIRNELPGIIRDLRSEIGAVKNRIDHAYGSRVTPKDCEIYLKKRIKKFEHWSKEAADGVYRDLECEQVHDVGYACQDCLGFFSRFGENSVEGQDKRLRSNIRMLNRAFAATMRRFGKTVTIQEGAVVARDPDGQSTRDQTRIRHIPTADAFPHYRDLLLRRYSFPNPRYVTRRDHEAMVAMEIERWRSLEAPEEASYAACWGLLDYQSRLWEEIATNHLLAVWEMTDKFIDSGLTAAFSDSEVLLSLREHIIEENLTKMRQSSQTILKDLLKCRRGGNTGFYDGFADNTAFLQSQIPKNRQSRSPSPPLDAAPPPTAQARGPPQDPDTSVLDNIELITAQVAGLGGSLPLGNIATAAMGAVGAVFEDTFVSVAGDDDYDEREETGKQTPARIINQMEMYYEVSSPTGFACCMYTETVG